MNKLWTYKSNNNSVQKWGCDITPGICIRQSAGRWRMCSLSSQLPKSKHTLSLLKWKSLISANTLFRTLITIRINYTYLHQSSEHNHLQSTVYEWNITTARGWRWRWRPLAGVARPYSVQISTALCCAVLVLCSALTVQTSAWIPDCTLNWLCFTSPSIYMFYYFWCNTQMFKTTLQLSR